MSTINLVGIDDIQPPAGLLGVVSKYEGKTFEDREWTRQLVVEVRDAFQQSGYWQNQVLPRFDVTTDPGHAADVAVTLIINRGQIYRLKNIAVINAKQFSPEQLRSLFPLKPGEVFNTALIREGLEKMRIAYGHVGYINFTPVPETQTNPDHTVSLTIDIDEGKQFRVRVVQILGVPEELARGMLQKFNMRGPYDSGSVEKWIDELRPEFPEELRNKSADALLEFRKNESAGTIELTLHLEHAH